MGALPKIAKSDNMKQRVAKSDRYCPSLSDACMEWANHYHIGITACRVRKPRDKGPVESAVNQLYQYAYARIQYEVFYTLDELNTRLWELLWEYANKPFKGRTRWQIFTEDEKPNMNPLPAEMHRFRHRKTVKLGSSYHVCVGSERHMYSVPYNYVGRMVTVMWDMEYVEVFLGTMRLCVHRRSYEAYGYTTDKNHMPESRRSWRTLTVSPSTPSTIMLPAGRSASTTTSPLAETHAASAAPSANTLFFFIAISPDVLLLYHKYHRHEPCAGCNSLFTDKQQVFFVRVDA